MVKRMSKAALEAERNRYVCLAVSTLHLEKIGTIPTLKLLRDSNARVAVSTDRGYSVIECHPAYLPIWTSQTDVPILGKREGPCNPYVLINGIKREQARMQAEADAVFPPVGSLPGWDEEK